MDTTEKTMDPSPPAWLRSYKAHHASISPNYASQVRPQTPGAFIKEAPIEPIPSKDEKKAPTTVTDPQHTDPEPTAAAGDAFAFQSTISLTLHNGMSLDKTYSNSTPNSSPQKASFHQDVIDEKPAVPRMSERRRTGDEPVQKKRRGTVCRVLAEWRGMLRKKVIRLLEQAPPLACKSAWADDKCISAMRHRLPSGQPFPSDRGTKPTSSAAHHEAKVSRTSEPQRQQVFVAHACNPRRTSTGMPEPRPKPDPHALTHRYRSDICAKSHVLNTPIAQAPQPPPIEKASRTHYL
ncbi:MAG: hypothetical protein Q9183_001901 [Haloplaca sp. 2 TL-2023]